MEERKARQLVVDTGRELLKTGLVARTWGNVSCRLDTDNFVITPSGLDYTKTGEEDIVKMNLTTGEWQGIHKPSGERGVHIAAYQVFPEVNFVIHTHQTYASALGLAGFSHLDITEEEKRKLEGITLADYGLPGTKKLRNAVKTALQTGAKVVLMRHHGVLICGSSQEETMSKAILLEEICRRNIKGSFEVAKRPGSEEAEDLLWTVRGKFTYAALVQTPAVLVCADRGTPIYAQVDDMAQMIGRKISVISGSTLSILQALEKVNAVLVPGIGAVVRSDVEDDRAALELLVDKAAVCSIHTSVWKEKARISIFDAALMKLVYQKKYSKQKK
jgi:L-fuculose-phosphate aldolase